MPEDGDEGKQISEAAHGETTSTVSVQELSQAVTGRDESEEVEYDEFGLKIRKSNTRPTAIEEDAHEPSSEGRVPATTNPAPGTSREQLHTNGSAAEDFADGEPLGVLKGQPGSLTVKKVEEKPGPVDEGKAPLDREGSHAVDIPSGKSAEASVHHGSQHGPLSSSPELVRAGGVSEWSHQQLAPNPNCLEEEPQEEDEWQQMPAYATHTIYDDWGKVLAKEAAELDEEEAAYGHLGGAGKGYTKVQLDEDAESATSLDDTTAYLFKGAGPSNTLNEDDEGRDILSQMQATKELLTEGQRIAYVGLVRLSMIEMSKELDALERTRNAKKQIEFALEAMKMWSQKMMVRLFSHMEIDAAEQIMIEQLSDHGVVPGDLTPALMQNARVKNPVQEEAGSSKISVTSPPLASPSLQSTRGMSTSGGSRPGTPMSPASAPPPYDEKESSDYLDVKNPMDLAGQRKIDLDLRWTVLCDLFLVLLADSVYDARSRTLLEKVGQALEIPWLDICRFEKRVTDALEMQEEAAKENWNEEEHMDKRQKSSRNRKLLMMGLATVGGGLVIGLSAGLLAPVIGAGLAAGFTTIGVAGTSTFLAGAGGAAIITSTGIISGGAIAVKASSRRMGAVKTFEYRPLHNNKRVNLIVTIAGWMTGKVDDVRLPYSTVDPIMGDIYSVHWEPEMLQSMGQTINILATEALTQGLQQVLGSTILTALMAAISLPVVLTKLSYLIDNPWSVSQTRADFAGLILADSLIDRNLGVRPITLCGFSLGARVIFSCLKELAARGAYGVVQNVYLFGTPVVANKDDYIRARTVVSGRFVNGYSTNDWILGYLFRATSGGIMRVAGLSQIPVEGIENIDVTQFVPGHMSYRTAMPKILQEVGWMVDSLEFTEIEDPDPENHEKRQRELINEIEEARRQLEKKPSKRGLLGLFSKSKRNAERKEWETYDEQAKQAAAASGSDISENGNNILFDVDAISREVAALAAEGIEVREIQSTLPPMRLNMEALRTPSPRISDSSQPNSPYGTLRHTQSYSPGIPYRQKGSPVPAAASSSNGALPNGGNASPRWNDNDEYEESKVSMTFESPEPKAGSTPALERNSSSTPAAQRPALYSARSSPAATAAPSPRHNAWADEGEDGGEEVEMTFE